MSDESVKSEKTVDSAASEKPGAVPPGSFEQDIFAAMFGSLNPLRAYDTYLAACADTPETRQILDGVRHAATKYEEALRVVLSPPQNFNPPS